jgi:hypothetical protein
VQAGGLGTEEGGGGSRCPHACRVGEGEGERVSARRCQYEYMACGRNCPDTSILCSVGPNGGVQASVKARCNL